MNEIILRNHILKMYALQEINKLELIPTNDSVIYSLCTPGGKYYLKIYPPIRKRKNLSAELDYILSLNEKGVSVARPIKTALGQLYGTFIIENEEYIHALFDSIKGTKRETSVTENEAIQVAQELQRFHKAANDLHRSENIRTITVENMTVRPMEVIMPWIRSSQPLVEFYSNVIEQFKTKVQRLDGELKWGFCHGDFHLENIIFEKFSGPSIIDFDYCGYHWQIYDCATFIWSILPRESADNRQSLKLIDVFIREYWGSNINHEMMDLIYHYSLVRHIWRQAHRIEHDTDRNTVDYFKLLENQMNRMKEWIELLEITV